MSSKQNHAIVKNARRAPISRPGRSAASEDGTPGELMEIEFVKVGAVGSVVSAEDVHAVVVDNGGVGMAG